jgi:hypothetical protein
MTSKYKIGYLLYIFRIEKEWVIMDDIEGVVAYVEEIESISVNDEGIIFKSSDNYELKVNHGTRRRYQSWVDAIDIPVFKIKLIDILMVDRLYYACFKSLFRLSEIMCVKFAR